MLIRMRSVISRSKVLKSTVGLLDNAKSFSIEVPHVPCLIAFRHDDCQVKQKIGRPHYGRPSPICFGIFRIKQPREIF
jgi:hypothetical protein